jgi:hypothetical protein
MKKLVVCLAILAVAGASFAATTPNVPAGYTGLWRFQNNANLGAATVGSGMTFWTGVGDGTTQSNYGGQGIGSIYTYIGTPTNNNLFGDNCIFYESSMNYMHVTHNIAPNGGGSYVNSYTIMMDYCQTSGSGLWNENYYNSIFQTSQTNANDGDLFIKTPQVGGAPDYANSTIGVGDTGYSTGTFNANAWNRIVISVDNSNFFRVYVNGALLLDAEGQGLDSSRYSLDPTFNLFADNDWEDAWGMVGTVATWDHALSSAEVSAMGNASTTLVIPEPMTMTLLALGGLLLRRSK